VAWREKDDPFHLAEKSKYRIKERPGAPELTRPREKEKAPYISLLPLARQNHG